MITLRRASVADIAVLCHWDEQPHVLLGRGCDPELVKTQGLAEDEDWHWEKELPRKVDWREFLIAELDGRPIGFMQIIDPATEESHYWGDVPPNLRAIDIWIGEESDLGKGYGTEMMHQAIARCFSAPDVDAIIIDPLASNVRAHRFYERLGFRVVERRTFGDDDCFVMRLDRATWLAAQR